MVILTGKEPGTIHKLGIGAFAGLIAQSCTYPLEVTRRRMQTHGHVDTHAGVNKVSGERLWDAPHGRLCVVPIVSACTIVLVEHLKLSSAGLVYWRVTIRSDLAQTDTFDLLYILYSGREAEAGYSDGVTMCGYIADSKPGVLLDP